MGAEAVLRACSTRGAQVLDHGCARKQGCFWFDFNRLYPLDISAPVTEKMVAMDLIYFPGR